MAKERKGSKENPITQKDLERAANKLKSSDRAFVIKEATIKDDFCNYSYEIISGIGRGDSESAKGSNIIDIDMHKAFAKFNVHLAVIDDAFKYKGVEIADIDKEHNHELTGYYQVTGFKIKGGKENESIVLIGTKYVSTAGARMEIATPKIALDNLSSYKWYNELRKAADNAREEVALYKEGKYTEVEPEEKEDPAQLKIDMGEAVESEENESMEDFEGAKV